VFLRPHEHLLLVECIIKGINSCNYKALYGPAYITNVFCMFAWHDLKHILHFFFVLYFFHERMKQETKIVRAFHFECSVVWCSIKGLVRVGPDSLV